MAAPPAARVRSYTPSHARRTRCRARPPTHVWRPRRLPAVHVGADGTLDGGADQVYLCAGGRYRNCCACVCGALLPPLVQLRLVAAPQALHPLAGTVPRHHRDLRAAEGAGGGRVHARVLRVDATGARPGASTPDYDTPALASRHYSWLCTPPLPSAAAFCLRITQLHRTFARRASRRCALTSHAVENSTLKLVRHLAIGSFSPTGATKSRRM